MEKEPINIKDAKNTGIDELFKKLVSDKKKSVTNMCFYTGFYPAYRLLSSVIFQNWIQFTGKNTWEKLSQKVI